MVWVCTGWTGWFSLSEMKWKHNEMTLVSCNQSLINTFFFSYPWARRVLILDPFWLSEIKWRHNEMTFLSCNQSLMNTFFFLTVGQAVVGSGLGTALDLFNRRPPPSHTGEELQTARDYKCIHILKFISCIHQSTHIFFCFQPHDFLLPFASSLPGINSLAINTGPCLFRTAEKR